MNMSIKSLKLPFVIIVLADPVLFIPCSGFLPFGVDLVSLHLPQFSLLLSRLKELACGINLRTWCYASLSHSPTQPNPTFPDIDEMPNLTFETRSRFCFLQSRASRRERDFVHLISGFETRSRISFT